MKKINNRLKEIREEFGFSKSFVAKAIGVSFSTYTKYELNYSQPKLKVINNLANFYNLSIDYIIGRTDKK